MVTTHVYNEIGLFTAIVTASNSLGDEFFVTTVVRIIEPLNQDKFIFLPVIFLLNPK
jgi:hypothetical protein